VGYDLTTNAGLKQYYFTVAKKSPHHMCQAVRFLVNLYHHGAKFRLLPQPEEDWLRNLAIMVLKDQDPETGFWGYEAAPRSMAVTYHIIDGMFGHCPIPRPDREDFPVPWMSIGVKKVPNAPRIIDTVFSLRASPNGKGGVKELPAWPAYVYDYKDGLPRKGGHQCALASTSNAIYLLRVASRFVGPSLQPRIYKTVREAFRYVQEKCITPDGLWKQRDTDAGVTSGAFLPRIIDSSSYLERRLEPRMATPIVAAVSPREGVRLFSWSDAAADCTSVRVYAAPKGTSPLDLNETHLVGIIQRTGSKITEMDPFVALRRLKEASRQHWNLNWGLGSHSYTQWKLAMLREPLPATTYCNPLKLTDEHLAPKKTAALETPEDASAKGEDGETPPEDGDQKKAGTEAAGDDEQGEKADGEGEEKKAGEAADAASEAGAAAEPETAAARLFQGQFYAAAVSWYGEESRPVLVKVVVKRAPKPKETGEGEKETGEGEKETGEGEKETGEGEKEGESEKKDKPAE